MENLIHLQMILRKCVIIIYRKEFSGLYIGNTTTCHYQSRMPDFWTDDIKLVLQIIYELMIS